MSLIINKKLTLSNGVEIPVIGFGTSRFKHKEEVSDELCKDCIKHAILNGCRHIDTAKHYKNEHLVKKAIQESKVKRNEIFITSKLYPSDMGYDNALKAFETSCKQLGTNYLDLYLIHFPVILGKKQTYEEAKKLRLDTWAAFEHLYKEKKCRAIGVSNYMPHHINEIIEANMMLPHVNQCEFHSYYNNKDLFEFCKKHGILFEGYCPLAKGKLLNDELLQNLAQKYSKPIAQIAFQWSIQNGVVTIPSSWNLSRIEQNFEMEEFLIDVEDMQQLWSINKDLKCSWDPTNVL